MKTSSPQKRISMLIMSKRRKLKLSLRFAAAQAGVSAATFSRLERGKSPNLPDTETLAKVATWLGMSLNEILDFQDTPENSIVEEPTTPDVVEVHLRADKNLAPDTAEALAKMFKVLYDQATKPPKV